MSGIAHESITHTLIQLTKFHHANCWLFNGSRDEILLQCQVIERPKGNLNQRITLRDKFDLSHQKLFRRKLIAVANATSSTVENKKLLSMQTPLKPGWNIKCGLQLRVTTERFLKFFLNENPKTPERGKCWLSHLNSRLSANSNAALTSHGYPEIETFQYDRKIGPI